MAAKSNRNIYLDLSFVIPYFRGSSLIERDLGFVIHKLGAERMIYGSDHPEVTVRAAYAEALSVFEGYRLTERQIETICGGTITEILAAAV
jgi:predicted TIM-barrel fold metal-dependent hydrolase